MPVYMRHPEREVLGLVTQSQLLPWLWCQRSAEGFPSNVLQLKLKDWKTSVLCRPDMLSVVGLQTTLAKAFRMIKSEQVSSVAMVDADDELVGNISTSNIKVCIASGQSSSR